MPRLVFVVYGYPQTTVGFWPKMIYTFTSDTPKSV